MKPESIKSLDNPAVRHFAKLQKDRAYREECGEYVLEGAKLLKEAAASGITPRTVFYLERCRDSFDNEAMEQAGYVRLFCANEKIIEKISDVKAPQGIVFSCALPDTGLPHNLPQSSYLILDGLSDPGNLGTVIRTADAFGLGGIILTGECADPFAPKTVRSAMGSLFRKKLYFSEPGEIKNVLELSGIPIYSAVLSDEAKSLTETALRNAAVVIGNEAHGVSEEIRKISSGMIKIPMTGQTESLNAAVSAAIIMWEMTKSR